jgi:hypothetical protein
MKPGDWYLFACPFFFTYVGRYVRHLSFQDLVIADAIYFTRTGATFDRLCSEGLVLTGGKKSLYHPAAVPLELPTGEVIRGGVIIPAQGPKHPWRAGTPWVKS